MQLWMGGIASLPSAGPMTSIQAKFAVFYGTVDERPSGWYWTGAPDDLDEPPKGPITGPFETKADAMEHAIRRLPATTSQRQATPQTDQTIAIYCEQPGNGVSQV
jgi:hypothetical protein